MLETAGRLRRAHPELQVAVSHSPTIASERLMPLLAAAPWATPVRDDYYPLLRFATAGIVASGTATLEAACSNLPFALVYRVSPLSFAIGKRVVRIPHIGLVNIVAGAEVVPEFLQDEVQPEKLAPAMEPLLFDPQIRRCMQDKLTGVRQSLGEPGASTRTAALILKQLDLHQLETI